MKKYLLRSTAIVALLLTVSFASSAQIIVKVRPIAPVIVRPVAPGPKHIWVSGEYAYRGGRYEYVNGYWAVPPPQRAHWVEGKWKHRRGGWVWVPGHWR